MTYLALLKEKLCQALLKEKLCLLKTIQSPFVLVAVVELPLKDSSFKPGVRKLLQHPGHIFARTYHYRSHLKIFIFCMKQETSILLVRTNWYSKALYV